jgi:putative ABC transport system permease protein
MSGTLAQDVRYAWRSLSVRRGWSLAALIALALGIGANTAIFSIIDTVLLHPVPFSDPDRLIWLSEQNQKTRSQMNVSLPNFSDWRTRQKSFDGIAAARYDNFNIADSDKPVRVRASFVSHELFRVLRVNPLRGQALESTDERSGSQRVVVMGYGLWQRRYGGDASIVGRSIRINAEAFTVVGIMPPGFEFPNSGLSGSEMWAPLRFDGPEASEAARTQRNLMVIGRLAPGVTLEQAGSEMASLARQTAAEHRAAGTDMTATVRPWEQPARASSGSCSPKASCWPALRA